MNTIELQTDFPNEDLTDKNTSALRELFRQPHMLYTASPENPDGHIEDSLLRLSLTPTDPSTVKSHELFAQVEAILRPYRSQLTVTERLDFTYGYTLGELITSLVSSGELLSVDAPAGFALRGLEQSIAGRSLAEFRDETTEQFQDEQPRVTQLVIESVAGKHRQSVPSALLGAAVKRQIELDSRDYTQSLT